MRIVSIGTKNQVVIPLEVRKKIAGVQPGKKVSIYALDADTIAIKASPTSWLDRASGAMQGIWEQAVEKKLEDSREAWDAR
ncbi:MAG: AbrB/MazE/SpoVT family DNA-binding domain-containing protein [bacterium]|nr:AbrB/MazE/SpoVT family DNA-binding domain-containing protein [bacterium]